MKLYIARHGQSEANKIGIMAGIQDDSPLSEHGWQDAAKIAEHMKGFRGLFVTTPLHRALETAEYVRDQIFPGAPIRVDADFSERDMGSATDRPRDEYVRMERSDAVIAGAETPEQMYERVKHGLVTLRQANRDTLLVTHDATCRMIICVLSGKSPHDFATIPNPKNGDITMFNL